MGRIFPKRTSQDAADCFNCGWMVLFMLVLFLFSFVVPLHPSFYTTQNQQTTQMDNDQSTTTSPVQVPNVKVGCWMPEGLSTSQIIYANSLCQTEFNAAIRGSENVGVYKSPSLMDPIPRDGSRPSSIYINTSASDAAQQLSKEKMLENENTILSSESIKSDIQKLVTYKTPLSFLIFAVCVAAPQLVFSFLSDCLCSFNVGETLESAKQMDKTTGSNRKQVLNEMSASICKTIGSTSHTISILYLFKKVTAVVICIGVLLSITQHALPEVEQLEKDLVYANNKMTQSADAYTKAVQKEEEIMKSNLDAFAPPNNFLMCDFQIRRLQTVDRYTVECMVESPRLDKVNSEKNGGSQNNGSNVNSKSNRNQQNLAQFVRMLLESALSLFVVTIIANVISLVSWLMKLCLSSSKSGLGLSKNASMDLVFLVQMAKINASAFVGHNLAQMSNGGFEKTELTEMGDNE